MENKGLCFRCEYRAQFLEEEHAPRFECGQINNTYVGCYAYKPVKPIILKKRKGDKRPQFAGHGFSARSEYGGEPEMELNLSKNKKGSILYWTPKK
jgi:hypothetical protein